MYYRFGHTTECRYFVGNEERRGKLPPGWYEMITEGCGEVQLALGGKGFPGQSSRFLIAKSALSESLDSMTHEQVAKLRRENS